jgi:hypothetical protein
MAYYVFDLDETLANTYTPFYMLCALRPEETTINNVVISTGLRNMLKRAYRVFVKLVAAAEISSSPLGILQPGIVDIFSLIEQQRATGICENVVIYSNNGSLAMLEFIRDLLRAIMGDGLLISDCIYWGDPRREVEIEKGKPGVAKKTWEVISTILKERPTGAPIDLSPEDIIFFDDQVHEDLMQTLGPIHHYVHVKPYTHRASLQKVLELYKLALTRAGLFRSPALLDEFHRVVEPICAKATTFMEHLYNITLNTPKTSLNTPTPRPSDAILKMQAAIQSMNDEVYIRSLRGGVRETSKRNRRTGTRKARGGARKEDY